MKDIGLEALEELIASRKQRNAEKPKVQLQPEVYTFSWLNSGNPWNPEGTPEYVVEALAHKIRYWIMIASTIILCAAAIAGVGVHAASPPSYSEYDDWPLEHQGETLTYEQYLEKHAELAKGAPIATGVSIVILIGVALYAVCFAASLTGDEWLYFGEALQLAAIWLLIASIVTFGVILIVMGLMWLVSAVFGFIARR